MHSETVTVAFRLHHNGNAESARDALMGMIEDFVICECSELVNNIEIMVTSAELLNATND